MIHDIDQARSLWIKKGLYKWYFERQRWDQPCAVTAMLLMGWTFDIQEDSQLQLL